MGLPLLRAAHHDGALPGDDADRVGAQHPARRRRRVLLEPVEGLQPAQPLQVDDAATRLDLATEQAIIKVEVQRGQCCHVAGDVDFDDDGNLYLSTGDNTPASAPGANGYAPINDAPASTPASTRVAGAGNTNDLRGKILRIDVQDDGLLHDPGGQPLRAGHGDKTRPEIFVDGRAQPVPHRLRPGDQRRLVGRLRPRRGHGDADRGPMGYVEWQHGHHQAAQRRLALLPRPQRELQRVGLRDGDARGRGSTAAALEEQLALQHRPRDLPPATAPHALLRRPADRTSRGPMTDFGAGGGQAPMGGPIYHYDAENPSTTKFPAYWDGKAFLAEFSQDYLAVFDVRRDPTARSPDRGLPAQRRRSRRTGSRSPTT